LPSLLTASVWSSPSRGADGKTWLATRLLSEGKPTILEGTENPQNPFFSPDDAWIARVADGKLRKVSTHGGAPAVICDDADALHPDGKRFAVCPVPETAPEEKGNAHVTFLLNFGDELRRRLPPGK